MFHERYKTCKHWFIHKIGRHPISFGSVLAEIWLSITLLTDLTHAKWFQTFINVTYISKRNNLRQQRRASEISNCFREVVYATWALHAPYERTSNRVMASDFLSSSAGIYCVENSCIFLYLLMHGYNPSSYPKRALGIYKVIIPGTEWGAAQPPISSERAAAGIPAPLHPGFREDIPWIRKVWRHTPSRVKALERVRENRAPSAHFWV